MNRNISYGKKSSKSVKIKMRHLLMVFFFQTFFLCCLLNLNYILALLNPPNLKDTNINKEPKNCVII